ncbi:MAG TPA: hypothetical protein VHB97_00360 [Polyangia bacterium]|nr:hypothetical protein [Polyangia bacterium]
MKESALVACAALAVAAAAQSPAYAHIGASVAVAKFTAPADPAVDHADPNDSVTPTPFVWTTADASYTVTWVDGDTDPTGRFIFYYMDHQPTFQVTADDVESGGIATRIDDPVNNSGGYFASCYCDGDQGVTCPDVVRDPNGNCANQIVWNTAGIAPGTYWIIAVNNDPPFHVYYPSNAPIRVAHGGTPLPAVLIVRPDGFEAWNTVYHLQWLADGKPPLSFALASGVEDTGTAITPQTPIATGLTPTANSDGTYGYDWDVSQLPNNSFWVRLTVTDGDGSSTFSDSHFAVTIFHSGTTPPPPDMAMTPKKKSGCEIGPARDDGAPSRGMLSTLAVLGALAIAFYVARRAARR